MGALVRSILAVFAIIALLMCQGAVLQGVHADPFACAFNMGVFFAGELFCVAFIRLVRRPIFGAAPAPAVDRPMSALAILFGVLQIYPGAGALLIAGADSTAPDRWLFAGVGAVVLLSGGAFVFGGLRGLLKLMVPPETLVDR